MNMPEHIQIKLGGDDCTCYDLNEFFGVAFIIEPHNEDEPCNSEAINLTYGSSSDVQTLHDGDYLIKYGPGDVVGYPQADFERLYNAPTN